MKQVGEVWEFEGDVVAIASSPFVDGHGTTGYVVKSEYGYLTYAEDQELSRFEIGQKVTRQTGTEYEVVDGPRPGLSECFYCLKRVTEKGRVVHKFDASNNLKRVEND